MAELLPHIVAMDYNWVKNSCLTQSPKSGVVRQNATNFSCTFFMTLLKYVQSHPFFGCLTRKLLKS